MDVKGRDIATVAMYELEVTCQPCGQEGTATKATRWSVRARIVKPAGKHTTDSLR